MSEQKSPRDLLLARHASAGRQLDALRRETIVGHDAPATDGTSLPALLHTVFHPHRHIWQAIAAIWVGLLAFHFTLGRPPPNPVATPPPEAVAGWFAQQKYRDLLAQIDH